MFLKKVFLLLLFVSFSAGLAAQEVRTIVFNEDRDQKYMASKVYQLKHIRADDITPFVLGAVKRYVPDSNVQRMNYKYGKKHYIVVSTGVDMMPYVDDMVAKLDRPCSKKDPNGSIVDGDGIYRFVYYTKYRATDNMRETLRWTVSDGTSYFDASTSMFYWKDSKSDGTTFLKFLKALDRPVPQLNLQVNVYEINNDTFTELGVDYISWKNGPGAQLLGAGFDWTNFQSFTSVSSLENLTDIITEGPVGAMTGFGGFMVAPQFDATFLRMLTQKGKAKIATSGNIVVVNDFNADPGNDNFDGAKFKINFTPSYQSISKDEDNNIALDSLSGEEFWFYLRNPIIGFNDAATEAATIMFGWVLKIDDNVEKTNNGSPVINEEFFRSWLTLAAGSEKLIATYTKDLDVNQDDGLPYLSDIPILKYLTGATADSKAKTRVFITVTASPVVPETSLSQWAGKIVTAAEMLEKKNDEEN